MDYISLTDQINQFYEQHPNTGAGINVVIASYLYYLINGGVTGLDLSNTYGPKVFDKVSSVPAYIEQPKSLLQQRKELIAKNQHFTNFTKSQGMKRRKK